MASKPKTTLNGGVSFHAEGVAAALDAFTHLGSEVQGALRDVSLEIATDLATQVKASGQRQGRQARLLVETVAPKRDRIPSVTVGGKATVGRKPVQASKLLFGSEFGANPKTDKYSPHGFKGRTPQNGGYWIFPVVREFDALTRYLEAVDGLLSAFAEGAITSE